MASASVNEGTRLVAALTAAGFTIVGQRTGHYARLTWPGASDWRETLVVPVNDTFADYRHLLDAVTGVLRDAARRGDLARHALDLHAPEGGVV